MKKSIFLLALVASIGFSCCPTSKPNTGTDSATNTTHPAPGHKSDAGNDKDIIEPGLNLIVEIAHPTVTCVKTTIVSGAGNNYTPSVHVATAAGDVVLVADNTSAKALDPGLITPRVKDSTGKEFPCAITWDSGKKQYSCIANIGADTITIVVTDM